MITARRLTVVSLVAVTALSFGAGCAAETPQESAGQSADELGNSVCVPRANAAKDKHLKTCTGSPSAADAARCVEPHLASLQGYYTDLARLEVGWDQSLSAIVEDCVKRSNACPTDPAIEALVAAGYPRDRLPAKNCDAALKQARARCTDKIEPQLRKLDPNDPYLVKKSEEASQVTRFVVSSLSCVAGEALEGLELLMCTTVDANAVYDAEMRKCHGQCPAPTVGAKGCKPSGFSNIPACGEIRTSLFGTCDCVATSFCRQYQDKQSALDAEARENDVKKIICDDAKSYQAPQLSYDSAGKPNGVSVACLPL